MPNCFYDIESLDNVFTLCAAWPEQHRLEAYILADDGARGLIDQDLIRRTTYESNENFQGDIQLFDLCYEPHAERLARLIGVSDSRLVNDPDKPGKYPTEFRPVCDTDADFDETRHDYLFGYNSYNYDTTMLAHYFAQTWVPSGQIRHTNKETGVVEPWGFCDTFECTSAREMRDFNNDLFSRYKQQMPQGLREKPDGRGGFEKDTNGDRQRIRRAMIMSGRNLDVARLNEKQRKVALKRMLGMLGLQILESDKLTFGKNQINTAEEMADLIAYNASDCVNLYELFTHPYYQSEFAHKRSLLKRYPELVYNKKSASYEPDIRASQVRYDRLTIDSSSANYAEKSLCPYGHLTDFETVSFDYPSQRKVDELHSQGVDVRRVNVLEEAKKFFYANIHDEDARAAFNNVYAYYKSIEGKNFNDSETYLEDFGANGVLPKALTPYVLKEIPKRPNTLCYYAADATPTTCYVTFSTGGIHGAEYDKAHYDQDIEAFERTQADMEFVRTTYPDPLAARRAKTITTPDGTEHKWQDFVKSSATIKKLESLTQDERQAFWKTPTKPLLFKPCSDGSTKFNEVYTYISAVLANHEDFKSYYPNLCRMMDIFFNEALGYDRYGKFYDEKEHYGHLMRDKTLPADERENYHNLREGDKLLMNAASGKGDTNFESNIRVNNKIISMRCIGQLFTWQIGQAQALAGARIPSTNTDGLYSVMNEQRNNEILAREAKRIGVEIEPEVIGLISKDANNRLELDPTNGNIISAAGPSLCCRKDTTPTKSLAHAAIIDWALSEYLCVAANNYKGVSPHAPFNKEIGASILNAAQANFPDKAHLLRMFQIVIASSPASMTYVFATSDETDDVVWLQHYNRVFIMQDATPDTLHLQAAAARKVTPAMQKNRMKNNERADRHDDAKALIAFKKNGLELSDLPTGTDAIIRKVTGIEPTWPVFIENHSLLTMTEKKQDFIISGLNMDIYLGMLEHAYTHNWMNSQKVERGWSAWDNTIPE